MPIRGHMQHCADNGAGGTKCPSPHCIMLTGAAPCNTPANVFHLRTEFGGDTAPYHADDLYFMRERNAP